METTDFGQLYNTWYRRSFFFVKSYIQDEMIAEDIVAESLVKLWKMMSDREIEYPQALLFSLLRNKAIDQLRHENARENAELELADAYQRELSLRISTLEAYDPEEIFSFEVQDIIKHTLASLPEQTRCIFEMSRFEGIPVKEIAQKKELTPKAVEYHITKALKALRINLKDYLPLLYFLLK